jgi:uncharacterized protein
VNSEYIDLSAVVLESEGQVFRFDDLRGLLASEDDLKFKGPVSGELRLSGGRDELLVSGSVSADIVLQCSRCLGEAVWNVAKSFTGRFRPWEPDMLPAQEELGPREADVSWYHDDFLDIKEIFAEQIRLDMPVRFLCDAGCRGLCGMCGCNRNTETCGCAREELPGPFAGLGERLAKHQ